jgi:hypothetical protein
VIENKIGADDQDAQLYRYWRNIIYGKDNPYNEEDYNKSWERGILVYLTPEGTQPSPKSLGKPYDTSEKYDNFPDDLTKKKDKIKCISYKTDIYSWLCNCMGKIDANEHPRLYSALKQYVEWIAFYL